MQKRFSLPILTNSIYLKQIGRFLHTFTINVNDYFFFKYEPIQSYVILRMIDKIFLIISCKIFKKDDYIISCFLSAEKTRNRK